jgi:hypothetical protein
MPALIDNYTAFENITESQPRVANVRYVTEFYRPAISSTVVTVYSEQRKNQRILNLLKEFSLLQDNWDKDGALAPSASALVNARLLVHLLGIQSQSIFHAAPGPNGEVMVDVRNGNNSKSLEIIFYQDRAVSVLLSDNEEPSQRAFSFHELPGLLKWLNQK